MHFLPSLEKCERIELACEEHYAGGYASDISCFGIEGNTLLNHLAEKSRFAPAKLIRWLRAKGNPRCS